MRAARQILAVTLVASAMCADRVVASTPIERSESMVSTMASRLVRRLSSDFRRAAPVVRLSETRRDQGSVEVVVRSSAADEPLVPIELSPFQFRLPPPVR